MNRNLVASIVLACLVRGALALAESSTPRSDSTPQSQDSVADEYAARIQEMRQASATPSAGISETDDPTSAGEEIVEPPFTGDIVRGKEGIPFPDPSMVVPEQTPTPVAQAGVPEEQTPIPWQRPRRCERNETKRERYSETGSESEVFWDKLFVDEELVPIDSAEIYGTKTEIFPYGPKSGEGVYIRMEMYQVPCVPYRIRMTGGSYFYDSGLNALKNYDTNSAGRGALHSWVEQKLFGKPPKKR
jgi:hypothetical protein